MRLVYAVLLWALMSIGLRTVLEGVVSDYERGWIVGAASVVIFVVFREKSNERRGNE